MPLRMKEAPTRFELALAAMPSMDISATEFDSLLEYSASRPTFVYEGKTWKCNLHFRQKIYQGLDPFGTPQWIYLDAYPCWIIRRYEYYSETQCIVRDYRPVIVATTKKVA